MSVNLNTNTVFNHFLKTAENIIHHLDEDKDKRNDYLEKLKKAAAKQSEKDEKYKNILRTVKDLTTNISTDSNPDEILKAFKDKKDEMLDLQPDISNNSEYKDFLGQIDALINDADGNRNTAPLDDDIEMTQREMNVIDPFTKKRMTDPVKNKACGHVYERSSVTSVLQMNERTRCPVVGCSSKNPISLENIVADVLTRKYLHSTPVN